MNCEQFQSLIYEHVEGSLSPDEQAELRFHTEHCAACRHALTRERALSQHLKQSFDQTTAGLSFRPMAARTVRCAPGRLAQKCELYHPFKDALHLAWRWFTGNAFRPDAASAALVIMAFVLTTSWLHSPVAPSAPQVSDTQVHVVDVPMQIETRIFRRDGNLLLDAVGSTVAVGHARFVANHVSPE